MSTIPFEIPKDMQTNFDSGFTSVITLIVLSHILMSIFELFRNIIFASCWSRACDGRFVLDLKTCSDKLLSHCSWLIVSIACNIINFSFINGNMLHISWLILSAVLQYSTTFVVFRRSWMGWFVSYCWCLVCSFCQISSVMFLIRIFYSIS